MTRFTTKKTGCNKLTALALTGALLGVPLFSSAPRAAADEAQKLNDGNSAIAERHNDERRQETFSGVVTRDARGRVIEVRTDSKRDLVVELRDDAPRELRRGSRVRVSGNLRRDDNVLRRATVSLLDNGFPGGGFPGVQRTTLRGYVTRELRDRRFDLRSQNTTYEVVLTRDETRLRNGDHVEVTGVLYKDDTMRDASLRFLGGNDGGNGGGQVNVDFTGRVLDLSGRRFLNARADNGTNYQVRTNFDFDRDIRSGDRVRVVGTARRDGREVQATRVERLRQNGPGNGQRVDIRGTIREIKRVLFNGGNLIVRGDGGRTWTVRVGNVTNWRVGDRVRVRGIVQDTSLLNAQVDRL